MTKDENNYLIQTVSDIKTTQKEMFKKVDKIDDKLDRVDKETAINTEERKQREERIETLEQSYIDISKIITRHDANFKWIKGLSATLVSGTGLTLAFKKAIIEFFSNFNKG